MSAWWRSRDSYRVTCYAYDPLNRQTGIFYLTSGACNSSVLSSTPNVSLQYDGAGAYSVGSLTQISNANSTTQFTSFDAVGRTLASIQTTGSSAYNFAYTYDLAGNLTSEKYPSGRLLNLQYDLANRPTQVQNNATSTSYASNVTYNPVGGMSSLNLANGISRTISVNSRWQPSEIKDTKSSSTLLDLAYSWDSNSFHNNGSLLKQTITTPNSAFTQNYSYDLLNRIQTINDTAGSPTLTRTFNYDALGNTWLPPSGQSAGMPYNQLTPTAQSSYNSATNQLGTAGGTFAYDGTGNMTTLGQYALSYDYENRLVSAQQTTNSATASYVYDGAGERVQKALPSGTTNYVYDAFGQLAAEYTNTPPASACTTCYLTWDHLGSTRMVTDGSGTVIARHDFLPFGDEIPANSMGRASASLWNFTDNITQKFTGQERDETGLDYFDARFFSSAVGRFISPDPMSIGADLYNPQTWNGYAYVANSPLSDVDPDGMQTASSGSTGPTGGSAGSAGSNPWWSWNPLSISFTWGGSRGAAGNFGHFNGSGLGGQIQSPTWFKPGKAEDWSTLLVGFLDGVTADAYSSTMTGSMATFAEWAKTQSGYQGMHSAGFVFASVLGEGEAEAGATTRLWRAVEKEELADIIRFGDYNIHPNSTFKRFAFDETSLDAFIKANPTRRYTKTYIDIPTNKLKLMYQHGDPGGVGRAIGIDVYENPGFYTWFNTINIKR